MTQPNSPRIAVLISGGGTTLKNLIQQRAAGKLRAEIATVISSSPDAKGLEYAAAAHIPASIVDHKKFDAQTFSARIFEAVAGSGASWIAMGGFLRKLHVPQAWANRVVNIHPSLIPAFSGRGFYGRKVHQAVLEYGCKITGCTVHFVDNDYDHGPIIAQLAVDVLRNDNAESLAARVFAAECRLYPAVVNALASGAIHLAGRQVLVDPPIKID
jgi:phosphoribosylglycinamide formyltransferase-1